MTKLKKYIGRVKIAPISAAKRMASEKETDSGVLNNKFDLWAYSGRIITDGLFLFFSF